MENEIKEIIKHIEGNILSLSEEVSKVEKEDDISEYNKTI